MNVTAPGLIVVILAFAVIPAWVARSRNVLFVSDLALLVIAPLLFWASGSFLNPAWHNGLGDVVYPFVAIAAAVVVFYARVFVVDRIRSNPRSNSAIAFVTAAVVGVLVGFVIPPLYE
jgi:uncharacterized membrane protein YfcA